MWKPEHRRAAHRNDLRYPSDLTDAEWALAWRTQTLSDVREVLNGTFYVL